MPNRRVKEVIGKRSVPTAGITTTIREAAKIMKQCRSSAIMVVDKGTLVGICTERDIVLAWWRKTSIRTRRGALLHRFSNEHSAMKSWIADSRIRFRRRSTIIFSWGGACLGFGSGRSSVLRHR